MKSDLILAVIPETLRKYFFLAGMLLLLTIPVSLNAQTDSTQPAKDSVAAETPAAEEESSLIAPSIEFISVQKSDNTIDLKVAVQAKVKGTFYKLSLLKVSFVYVSDETEKALGFVITDANGKAVFNVKTDSLVPDKEGKMHFKAIFAGNKSMEATEEEVTIKKGRLVISPVKVDSLYTIQVKLTDLVSGEETAVPETVIGIYVKRMFNPMKVGEGTTDENGEATIEIPNNLPGDSKGNLTFIGRLDDNEIFGNLESTVIQKWGIPVSEQIEKQPRALWSSHPPIWMLVTFIILMSVVWGHYIVILFQLYRLRKEEPEEFAHPKTHHK